MKMVIEREKERDFFFTFSTMELVCTHIHITASTKWILGKKMAVLRRSGTTLATTEQQASQVSFHRSNGRPGSAVGHNNNE